MSSESQLDAFDENDCQCKVCDDILKKPMLLPCLHRFCHDCLESLLENEQDKFQCPECMEEYESSSIRENGLNDDFYMENIIECIQIRNSLRDEAAKECFDCCKHTKMTAYCFKCKDYLCDQCYRHHVNSKILKEHRKHTVILTELEGNQLSLEKCISLKEAPKCHIHTETKSQICCITCGNQPICAACTYGEHMGHSLREVSTWAKSESQNLSKELKKLEEHMQKFEAMRENLKDVEQEVVSKLNEKRNEAHIKYKSKISGVKEKIKEVREDDQLSSSKVKHLKQNFFKYLETEKEREIREIKQRYSNLVKKKKNEYESVQRQYEKRLTSIHQALEKQEEVFQSFLDTLDKNQEENFQNIQKIEKWCNSQDKFAKNVISTASLFKSTKDDWLAAKCMPSVCKSIQHFLKKEFPNFDYMPQFNVKGSPSFEIFQKTLLFFDSQIDIQVTEANLWAIDGITCTADGSIVITGRTSRDTYVNSNTFVSVIIIEGNTLRKNKMKSLRDSETSLDYYPPLDYYSRRYYDRYSRYCTVLSEYKVATVAKPDEIGIYDIRDGSYVRKTIDEAIRPVPDKSQSNSDVCDKTSKTQFSHSPLSKYFGWSTMDSERSREKKSKRPRNDLTCVTADSEKSLIFVGYANTDVYVFDDQLNYVHPLKLPDEVQSLQGMTVSKGNLIVCDKEGEKAYVVGMNESEGRVLLEIPTPTLDSCDWIPRGIVCTDSKGSIYMIWSKEKHRIVVKYSEDGCNLLTTRRVDTSVLCMSTVRREGTEKLLIVTIKNREPSLSVYLLDYYDVNSSIKSFMEVLTTNCPELNIVSKTTAKVQASAALPTQRRSDTKEISTVGKTQIEVLQANSWVIDGITSTRNGSIVISGRTSGKVYPYSDTFVSVITSEGKTLRKNKMKSLRDSETALDYYSRPDYYPRRDDCWYSRYCTVLSDFKIATVAKPDEIGIYDVRDGSYVRKSIDEAIRPALDKHESNSDICDKTAKKQLPSASMREIMLLPTIYSERSREKQSKRRRSDLTCVTADSEKSLIFVGYANKDVYVFDDQLNYLHPLKLPDEVQSLQGMTVSNGNLIVCDKQGENAYMVEMNQSEGSLLLEIPTPILESGDWIPQGSVCKDSKGSIYVMWSTVKDRIVVKYSEDGRKELETKKVSKSAFCMTTLERNDTTDLLVGAKNSDTLQIFSKF